MIEQEIEQNIELRTPPGPEPLPVIGNLLDIRSKGFIDFYMDVWRTYGDIAQIKLGPMPSYLFIRPEHIHHVLVKNPDTYVKGSSMNKLRGAIGNGIFTMEGEEWRGRRKMMQPTYTPKGIQQFADIMSSAADDIVQRWNGMSADTVFDMNVEMTRATMSVISQSIFGMDINDNFKEIGDSLHGLLEFVSNGVTALMEVPLFVPTPKNQRYKNDKKVVAEFIYGIINKRREEGLRNDLLSMMMTMQDEDGQTMNDEELHNEVLINFFAGNETTASLLTWTWYYLAKLPDIEAKLHEEVDRVLQGRIPTLDDIENLPYTRMILEETLRLYPPVMMTARSATEDDVVDGYKVPAGALAIVMPYATHRHPEFWERPDEFYPEHFLPEAVEKRPRYAFFPFGAGQRICIGNHFAMMETIIIVAHVAQHYKARFSVPHDGGIRFAGVIRPAQPLMMHLEKR